MKPLRLYNESYNTYKDTRCGVDAHADSLDNHANVREQTVMAAGVPGASAAPATSGVSHGVMPPHAGKEHADYTEGQYADG